MQLHFQSHGTTGPPLLILHGLFGSLDNWASISRQLGHTNRVFALDLRNHGRSPHSDEFNYAVIAEDLLEFMAAQKLERTNILGHSLGGKVAMHFALHYPGRVEKLIVVDIAPRAYPPAHLPLFDAMMSLDLGAFRERGEMDRALAAKIPEAGVRQFLLKNVGRDESGAFRWKLNLPAIFQNYELLNKSLDTTRVFEGPTLFIKGEKSDYISEEDRELIIKMFPRAEVVTVPGAGHWVHADAPEKVTEMVRKFLAQEPQK